MNKSLIIALLMVLLIAGCTTLTTGNDTVIIESEDEVTDALINVSTGVEDIGSTLDDLDSLLE